MMNHPHKHSPEMERCIDNCQECHEVCLHTVTHCLDKGGRHAEAHHVRLLLDCAEVCQRCAEDCERLADDDMMRRCAEICRRCAESCRQMAGVGVAAGSR